MDKQELAKYIDHTNLKPDATKEDIKKLCEEAKEMGFYAVCVNPGYVSFAKKQLEGTEVKIASVIGFPLGESLTKVKAYETACAVKDGADEIDMVISISHLVDGDYDYVKEDIKSVVDTAGAPVKVIFEINKLTNEQIEKACELSFLAGAKCVKTSTGFLGSGATEEAVRIMSKCVNNKGMFVKASGGVRDFETAMKMIDAGAKRIGTSSGAQILAGIQK